MSALVVLRRRVRPAAALAAVLIGLMAACGPTAVPDVPAAPAPAESPEESGELTEEEFAAFIGPGMEIDDDGDFGIGDAELVTAAGGTLVRANYPAGSASKSADGADGGLQAYFRLPGGPVDALELTYRVRFGEGFDFVKGGKLPGLFGGSEVSGGNIPDGTNGFSTRYMWRREGAGEIYAYLPSSEENGTSLGRGCFAFVPGQWTELRQQVRLNTPGTADGSVTVWQDGRLVLSRTQLEFRTVADLQIEGVFFSTFFGGGDTSWAATKDEHVDFAGFSTAPVSGPPPTETPAPLPTTADGSGGDDEDDQEDEQGGPECSGTGV